MTKFCVLGNDLRSENLRKILKKHNYKLSDLEDSNIVVTAIPFTKDGIKVNGEIITCDELIEMLKGTDKTLISGAFPKEVKNKLLNEQINHYDLMEKDSMAILNSIPTAEGAISTAILNTDFTLHGSNILILGYGRIGKVLAKMLNGIGAKVFCEARKESDIAMIKAMGYTPIHLDDLDNNLSKMNIIFNTIPQLILDDKRLDLISKDALIVDLASSPGGVDFKYAKDTEKRVEWSLAIPAKVAPYTAALYIKKEIDKILKDI